ncbi:MAG: DUF1598 domain-containing protein [Planctomycetota bacterium]
MNDVYTRSVTLLANAVLCIFLLTSTSFGQTDSKIQAHLDSGEFPNAIGLANTLPADKRDQWLGRIASAQMGSGASFGAYHSADSILSDQVRSSTLSSIRNQLEGNDPSQGGITEQDFFPLIELIQNTIDPESWQEAGGLGTIDAFPAGVFVDPQGTLQRIQVDPSQKITWLRQKPKRFGTSNQSSRLRMVSITRLEQAAQIRSAQGLEPTEKMEALAGIYEIELLFVDSVSGDIVIAGPAGPWTTDSDGRRINEETGRPVVLLDDLVVCLRNAWEEHGQFGCSITPRKQNLVATQQFIAQTSLKGRRWSEGIRTALGMQDIEVFGIDPQTHAARILVEADYHMKLLGMGLEDSIQEIPSYFERLQLNTDGTLPPMDVVRWWFTQNYDAIRTNAERNVFEFQGNGVKVLSENEFVTAQGDRIHTGQSNPMTEGFANDFTEHFRKVAERYPVYWQLKNVFDLALVSTLIKSEMLCQKVDWNRTYFDSRGDQVGHLYLPEKGPVANQVHSVMNEKVIRQRTQTSLLRHQLVGVSGGIAFDAPAVVRKRLKEVDTNDRLVTDDLSPSPDTILWWWD